MFTNVIAAVDGYDGGRDAIALAKLLGDGRLTLVGVHPDDPHRTRASLEGYWRAQHDDLQTILEGERDRLAPGAEVVVVGDASPGRALHRVAGDRAADLLVLGSAHHGPLGRSVAGDVGRAVLHGAPCPVAIAPKRFAGRRLETIVVGVDGSPESRAALERAVPLATDAGARLRVVVAWADPSPIIAAGVSESLDIVRVTEEHRARAEELLAATLAVRPEAEGVVVHGRTGPALEHAAAEADLLIVGSRGWGPAHRLALGSTSDWLVHHAPCAVLVVPRPAAAEAEGVRAQVERTSAAQAPTTAGG